MSRQAASSLMRIARNLEQQAVVKIIWFIAREAKRIIWNESGQNVEYDDAHAPCRRRENIYDTYSGCYAHYTYILYAYTICVFWANKSEKTAQPMHFLISQNLYKTLRFCISAEEQPAKIAQCSTPVMMLLDFQRQTFSNVLSNWLSTQTQKTHILFKTFIIGHTKYSIWIFQKSNKFAGK